MRVPKIAVLTLFLSSLSVPATEPGFTPTIQQPSDNQGQSGGLR